MTVFVPDSLDSLDAWLEGLSNTPAVYLVSAPSGDPYLGRTGMLRRRLKRLLGPRSAGSRLLTLRGLATRVEFWPTASRLANLLVFYEEARRHFPETYEKLLRFRWPSYVRLLSGSEFPRTTVTTRLSGGAGVHFGPFRSRAVAEEFDQGMLDLFQIRRCPEDLVPSPEHPGCIYGEMGRCMRPCQQVVGPDEYRSEVARVESFLATAGASLLHTISTARDRLSDELQFEEAARQQSRLTRLEQLLKLRDDLAAPVDKLCGVAVLPSTELQHVELRFMLSGVWMPTMEFNLSPPGAEITPLDRRLRESLVALAPAKPSARLQQEHLALLVRWVHSTWRDGEWLGFESIDKVPYRKLVNAIARVARGGTAPGGAPRLEGSRPSGSPLDDAARRA